MYFHQFIDVNLTAENSKLLKRPSKIFNKLKSAISGNMTPTEARRAEVMIGILQRLNTAFRQVGIKDIDFIKVNTNIAYEDHSDDDQNFDRAIESVCFQLEQGEHKSLDEIEIIAEHSEEDIKYILSIDVNRKPANGNSPIRIQILGLNRNLHRSKDESAASFQTRVENLARQHFKNETVLEDAVSNLETQFSNKTELLNSAIGNLFPNGTKKYGVITKLSSPHLVEVTHQKDSKFYLELAYIPVYMDVAHSLGETTKFKSLMERNQWTSNSITVADLFWEEPPKSNEDAVSNDSGFFDFELGGFFDGSSCGSGCGSSCGGGCGS